MIQTNPDWTMYGTAREIEFQLPGFKFNGPGTYLTNTDTVLIIAISRNEKTI